MIRWWRSSTEQSMSEWKECIRLSRRSSSSSPFVLCSRYCCDQDLLHRLSLPCPFLYHHPGLPCLLSVSSNMYIRAAIFLIYNLPLFKRVTLEALETVFAPSAVARQLALAVALETGMVSSKLLSHQSMPSILCTDLINSPYVCPFLHSFFA